MCEKKRRHLQKDEKRVRFGHYAFQRFYKLSAGAKKEKTYEDFCNSQYYNAFVKFGSFINNVRPLYPERYIDYVCLLYTSPSPRDMRRSRMPSSA